MTVRADTRPRAAAFAWAAWACILGLGVTGLAVNLSHGLRAPGGPSPEELFLPAAMALISAAFATVGLLIAIHRPRNAVVWPLYLLGSALLGIVLAEGSAGASPWAIWVTAWTIDPGLFGGLIFLLLLFPDGRLPSVRWRPVAWFAAMSLAGMVFIYAFAPGILRGHEALVNPLGVEAAGWLSAADDPVFLVVLAALLGSAAAPVVRYRRAGVEQRQQLKWLAAAGGLVALTFVLGPVVWFSDVPELGWHVLLAVGLGSWPVAVGIAILRYRLYDIDRIISRTVSYALLTGLLIATYLAVVFALQGLLRPLTGESNLTVAGATLLVAALFQPARRRVQANVDRRFNRTRYDAQRVVDDFRTRLRDEVKLDQLETELVSAARITVEPRQASLWLRDGAR